MCVCVHITDVVVGLEQTLYEVNEDTGMVTVCAVIMNPPSTQLLSIPFTLFANTFGGTASL